jgi:endonuclease G
LKDVRTYFPDRPRNCGAEPCHEDKDKIWESPDIRKDPGNLFHESGNDDDIHIVVPAALLEKNGSYTIRIEQENKPKPVSDNVAANVQLAIPNATEIGINPVNDIRKLELEMDYSTCKGYSSSFLPITVPFPKALKPLAKYVAKVPGTTNNILKYHTYSVLFHSVRMMPAVSAINVDGNPKKRLDNSPRDDKWLRDKRLGMDIQLDDEFYAGSNFDKGHLSRREDANYGTTAQLAKRNADLTCMYTNACPQVPALNRSNRSGLWGNLENLVLENGAIKENGATGKITVFNGPIFKESDPVFRGIQIPVEFYKIIVWPTSTKQIRATAFKLSQGHLLDDINLEDLNIDQNIVFKEYQCSIASIITATQLDFKALLPFDTFKATAKPMELKSEEALVGRIEGA